MNFTSGGYLIRGGRELFPKLLSEIEKEGIAIKGNPDIFVRDYASFGIDEARELRDRASLKAVAGGGRIFIISAAGMTSEAQNALLKTLEEPAAEATFFLLVATPETLLPTLRSRIQNFELESPKNGRVTEAESQVDVNKFISSDPQGRLSMLKPLLEKDEEDKRDIGAILSFLSNLERAIASPFSTHPLQSLRCTSIQSFVPSSEISSISSAINSACSCLAFTYLS